MSAMTEPRRSRQQNGPRCLRRQRAKLSRAGSRKQIMLLNNKRMLINTYTISRVDVNRIELNKVI